MTQFMTNDPSLTQEEVDELLAEYEETSHKAVQGIGAHLEEALRSGEYKYKIEWCAKKEPSCTHEVAKYLGFTESYDYCKKCGDKL